MLRIRNQVKKKKKKKKANEETDSFDDFADSDPETEPDVILYPSLPYLWPVRWPTSESGPV